MQQQKGTISGGLIGSINAVASPLFDVALIGGKTKSALPVVSPSDLLKKPVVSKRPKAPAPCPPKGIMDGSPFLQQDASSDTSCSVFGPHAVTCRVTSHPPAQHSSTSPSSGGGISSGSSRLFSHPSGKEYLIQPEYDEVCEQDDEVIAGRLPFYYANEPPARVDPVPTELYSIVAKGSQTHPENINESGRLQDSVVDLALGSNAPIARVHDDDNDDTDASTLSDGCVRSPPNRRRAQNGWVSKENAGWGVVELTDGTTAESATAPQSARLPETPISKPARSRRKNDEREQRGTDSCFPSARLSIGLLQKETKPPVRPLPPSRETLDRNSVMRLSLGRVSHYKPGSRGIPAYAASRASESPPASASARAVVCVDYDGRPLKDASKSDESLQQSGPIASGTESHEAGVLSAEPTQSVVSSRRSMFEGITRNSGPVDFAATDVPAPRNATHGLSHATGGFKNNATID